MNDQKDREIEFALVQTAGARLPRPMHNQLLEDYLLNLCATVLGHIEFSDHFMIDRITALGFRAKYNDIDELITDFDFTVAGRIRAVKYLRGIK